MARIKFEGDASSVVAAQTEIRKGASKLSEEYRQVAKESRKLERDAKKAFLESGSGAKKYQRDLQRLRQLLKGGRITQDEFRAGVDRLSRSYRTVAVTRRSAFGSAALAQLSTYVAGVVSLGVATRLAVTAFRQYAEERKAQAATAGQDARALAPAAQLARTPEQQALFIRERDKLFRLGAGEASPRIAYELQSAEQLTRENRLVFGGAAAASVFKGQTPEVIAASAKIQKTFGGVLSGIASEALAAATKVTGAGAQDVIQAATGGAAAAKVLGFSRQELFSAVGIVGGARKSAEVGGTQVEALFASIDKDRTLLGKTIPESIANIQRRVEGGETEREILGGRKEAIGAFRGLRDGIEQFNSLMKDVGTAEDRNLVVQKTRIARTDPALLNEINLRQAQAAREQAERPFALETQRRQAAVERARILTPTTQPLSRFAQTSAGTVADVVGLDPVLSGELVETAGETAATTEAAIGHMMPRMLQILLDIAGNTRKGANNTAPTPPTPQPEN